MEPVQLKDRDFVFVIDQSGSMATQDQKGGKSRWESAQETAIALAGKIAKFDPDGYSLYTFNAKRYCTCEPHLQRKRSQRIDQSGRCVECCIQRLSDPQDCWQDSAQW